MSGDISGEEEVETMTVVTGVIRHRLCEKCCSVLRRLYSSCGTNAQMLLKCFALSVVFFSFFYTFKSDTQKTGVCVCLYSFICVQEVIQTKYCGHKHEKLRS